MTTHHDNSSQTRVQDEAPYKTMERALYYLADNYQHQPSLRELAEMAGISEFYFQKLFTRWVGISPKRFCQFLTKEHIKLLLDAGHNPLDACYQAGLSGPGRMHELFISTEALSPARYRAMGKGLVIHYGMHESPFGDYLLGVTDKGICHLGFVNGTKHDNLAELRAQWALATLVEDVKITGGVHQQIFAAGQTGGRQLKLLLKGTNFQIQVWQALLKIPFGTVASYEDVAARINRPSATRAAASAIARNNIAWLIPCHRVVRKIGTTGQYRWGSERKKIILGYESAASEGL